MRRRGHLLRLLGAHGVAVLDRRPARAEVLQPMLQSLLENGLGRLRGGSTLGRLRALRRLLRNAAAAARPCIAALEGRLLLLLHLELELHPLMVGNRRLLLGRACVALRLLTWGACRRTLPHPRLPHESLALRRLWLLELTVIHPHLLLLLLQLLLLLLQLLLLLLLLLQLLLLLLLQLLLLLKLLQLLLLLLSS